MTDFSDSSNSDSSYNSSDINVATEDYVRIVRAAAGKHFCAGANFGTGNDDNTGSDDFTEEGFRNTTGKLYREAARLFECRTPIVGAIHGAAIGGEEAAEIGLVDILTSFEQVRDRAMELAREIAANAPLAVSSVKATLRQSLADQVRGATEHELKEQQWLRATEDAGEGIRAVAERRSGNFQGR